MGDERLDGWTSTRNFHICYLRGRTMKGSRPDGWSRIGNFLNCWMRVRTKVDCRPDGYIWIVILVLCKSASGPRLTVVRTVIFELRFLPYLRARLDGNPRRPDGWSNLPLNELGKNLKLIDHWEASRWAAETSGRMQAGIEASRYSGASGRKVHVVRTDDAWSVWRPVGWNSGQMSVRTGWHVVWTADREPKSSKL